MLLLKPNCECCNKDLPPSAADARICSYECTFCADCVESRLNNACPNCGGNFVSRPIRSAVNLLSSPASEKRIYGKGPACVAARAQNAE